MATTNARAVSQPITSGHLEAIAGVCPETEGVCSLFPLHRMIPRSVLTSRRRNQSSVDSRGIELSIIEVCLSSVCRSLQICSKAHWTC
jgi:hypothetical protein